MAGKFVSTLVPLLALVCVAAALRTANDDFVIGQDDSNVVLNCADSKSIAVKYWNMCGLKIQLSSCPLPSITKRFATAEDDEKFYNALEAKKNRDIKFDGILESIKASNTFLMHNKRAHNAKLRNIRRLCCKNTIIPNCNDRKFLETCPGGSRFKQNSYDEIIFIGCGLAADELAQEG
ncbi:hypothetical protein TrispH2_010967 [Trichoplax sp. H2]|uniref:Expressed protein n=1 Tax=Trichoplax adhaerens TaxID=10228 RepID=B3SA61_TRIAD|nr:expressed protein [Trichoplax adhaerens]EDV20377.1 expressed protein [Trichoplax adhaerens]RDD37628.1 hypothetical protein TrispH2_010967 [Trichoplax sp. H2]|eukprot:XP_002117071.1 expressed protein [Trichoplax adhaerens]